VFPVIGPGGRLGPGQLRRQDERGPRTDRAPQDPPACREQAASGPNGRDPKKRTYNPRYYNGVNGGCQLSPSSHARVRAATVSDRGRPRSLTVAARTRGPVIDAAPSAGIDCFQRGRHVGGGSLGGRTGMRLLPNPV